MRVLHVSWEYPPVVYGGLGRHVHALAEAQAAAGHDVTVLTQQPPGAAAREVLNGVSVIRVEPPTPTVPREPDPLVAWVERLDARMASEAANVVRALEPQVVHAHDWVVNHSAREARRYSGAPLVVTIHATEAGRHQGWITSDLSRRIHGLEHQLISRAQRVITCSNAMRVEVETAFNTEPERIDVIPNGIDLGHWQIAAETRSYARSQFAPTGSLIVYVGRLEWEKGVHTLIDALPAVVAQHPDLHVVIAGTGTYEAMLHQHGRELTEAGVVTFTGWLPEDELQALAAAADVAVVPSLYEPFGLVALEAGALGIPLVVARTGGLADIVTDGVSGSTFAAGS
ncbi:MAG: glycosyltransferase family 4 protein, partial [Actinomycetes bacterium]